MPEYEEVYFGYHPADKYWESPVWSFGNPDNEESNESEFDRVNTPVKFPATLDPGAIMSPGCAMYRL
jgi:hypothetical protein